MRMLVKTLTFIICAPIFAGAINASLVEQSANARSEDEAAIRAIVKRLQEGWNAGSGKIFAEPFAEDADYVIINGGRIKGRNAIEAGHQRIFATIYKNSHISSSVQSVRFLSDAIAIAHIEWHLKHFEGAVAREGKAMNSIVVAKENGKWSIVAFQNTPVAGEQR
jgi:uncharacterized protein (TIGR02246 family)